MTRAHSLPAVADRPAPRDDFETNPVGTMTELEQLRHGLGVDELRAENTALRELLTAVHDLAVECFEKDPTLIKRIVEVTR